VVRSPRAINAERRLAVAAADGLRRASQEAPKSVMP
jgi:hypothetical protein